MGETCLHPGRTSRDSGALRTWKRPRGYLSGPEWDLHPYHRRRVAEMCPPWKIDRSMVPVETIAGLQRDCSQLPVANICVYEPLELTFADKAVQLKHGVQFGFVGLP